MNALKKMELLESRLKDIKPLSCKWIYSKKRHESDGGVLIDSQCGSLSGFPRKRILMKLLAQFQRSITFVWVVIS